MGTDPAKQVMARIDGLAEISDEPGALTRTFCSAAMRRANDQVGLWMREAGMNVREDAIGNLIGEYATGDSRGAQPGKKLLLLGSHLDTVRNAGKFDGPLGVLLAIACVEEIQRDRIELPFDLAVIGFADEEGVRYQSAYLGSRVVAGTFDAADLQRADTDGVSMAEAIRRFGGRPDRLKQARWDGGNLLGYVEAHIEQGPVLEENDLAVGFVTAIAGQTRLRFTFAGKAGHAGTTPMRLRQDALCAAAEFVLSVERHARKRPGLAATVGQIQVNPNASNIIPGTAVLTLDVRHQEDSARRAAVGDFQKLSQRIGALRKVKVNGTIVQQTSSVPCSKPLSGVLQRAAQIHQPRVLALPSGAGHDAAVLAQITPVAMLFIRCKGGVSHNPAESVKAADVRVALRVMSDFLQLLAKEYGRL
jgi:allantoate deiminase